MLGLLLWTDEKKVEKRHNRRQKDERRPETPTVRVLRENDRKNENKSFIAIIHPSTLSHGRSKPSFKFSVR